MKTLASIAMMLVIVYALALLALFLLQRSLIYFPTPAADSFSAEPIDFENQGFKLQGWVLNPDRERALIYFGGNSESITLNRDHFESIFADYSVYLVDYRGYGRSQGKPSEAALFADALRIYDELKNRHTSISLLGRSLGSGVAVYLASQRAVEKLILLTPYDSIAAVAQGHYPLFPVHWLIRDRFDSAHWGKDIDKPVLVVAAERDQVVPMRHSQALLRSLAQASVSYKLIKGAAHNNITEFREYHDALRKFLAAGD